MDFGWLIFGYFILSLVISLLAGFMRITGSVDEREMGAKLFVNWWVGSLSVIVVALIVNFVIKPILEFIF